MEITEVRIKLTDDSDDRLQAFCSITFDNCFVIRDLKIIEGSSGPFVAMPSRKLTAHCPRCGCKNHLRAAYCNQCGGKLNPDRDLRDQAGRTKLYADVAHPINSACREMIQERVIAEFQRELELSQKPGYVSHYDDDYTDTIETADEKPAAREPERAEPENGRQSNAPPARVRAPEPPVAEPRPPHTSQTAPAKTDANPPSSSTSPGGGFGAGIFDD